MPFIPLTAFPQSSCIGCGGSGGGGVREVVLLPPSFGITWIVPSKTKEIFNKTIIRTVLDMRSFSEVNLRANMVKAAPSQSVLHIEYEKPDKTWGALSSTELYIDVAGFNQSGYSPIDVAAKVENCVIRITAEGGDDENNAVFGSISMELK